MHDRSRDHISYILTYTMRVGGVKTVTLVAGTANIKVPVAKFATAVTNIIGT